MHKRVCFAFCLVALGLLTSASRAAADDHHDGYRDNVRLYGGLWLGFGGKGEVDYSVLGVRTSPNDDEVTTVGGQLGVDIPVMRWVSLGLEARLGAFNTEDLDEAGIDRSKLIDFDFKPRLTLPLRKAPVEVYFTLPVGITIPILADDFGNGNVVDANVGWNLGVGAGLNFWLTKRIALNLEPNYLMHWFNLDVPVGEGSVKLQQFTLFFNAVLAL